MKTKLVSSKTRSSANGLGLYGRQWHVVNSKFVGTDALVCKRCTVPMHI